MRRTKEEKAKEKARDRRLAKGFGSFLKEDDPALDRKTAKAAFLALPKARRLKIRHRYEASGEGFTFLAWWKAEQEKQDDPSVAQKEGRAHRKGKRAKEVTLTISHDKKKLDKHVREAMAIPTSPKKPYVALLQPMTIVPDDAAGKVVVADAGSIVRLMDQTTLYRDYMSPITHRADEVLVQYGNVKTLALGWVSGRTDQLAPSKGPTFLVKTSNEEALTGWDRLRLKVARSRTKDPSNWIAPWLANHGAKHPRELREVTRLFGGKPIKNEDVEDRIVRLFTLILHTELDMATAKSKKSKVKKSAKSAKTAKVEKAEKTTKKAKKVKGKEKAASKDKFSEKSDLVTRKFNDYVIKRLIKENPFREGSNRAKLWSKLKKGMTVVEFNAFGDGRARTELRHYRASGWIKLRRPATA